jgi:hypothetical protein
LAASFSTGVTALTLTDVQLSIESANTSDGNTFAVELLPDTGSTSPNFGAVLEAITGVADSSLTGALADYDYVLGPVTLAANTRYWIGLSAPGTSSSVQWSYTSSQGTGSASEYFYDASIVSPNNPFGPFQMQVNISDSSAAPEPASGWLMISLTIVFGVCVTVSMARRRQRISVD